MWRLILFYLAVLLAIVLTIRYDLGWADNPPDWSTITAVLIAEAASEPPEGMLAVAEVMRNRKWNLRAFSASRRKDLAQFVARQPFRVHETAARAISTARSGSDTVHGATHYENIHAFGVPYWARGRRPVAVIGRHTFWRIPA